MEDELDFKVLLPDTVEERPLEEVSNSTLWVEANVARVRLKAGKIKYAVKDVLQDVWQAHELLTRNQVKGWSWRRYCHEIGVHHGTPLRWFEKYGMKYTIDSKFTPRHILEGVANATPNEPEVQEPEVLAPIPVVEPRKPAEVPRYFIEEVRQHKVPADAAIDFHKELGAVLPKVKKRVIKSFKESQEDSENEKTEEQKKLEAEQAKEKDIQSTWNDSIMALSKNAPLLKHQESLRGLINIIRIARRLNYDIKDFVFNENNPGSFVADHQGILWYDRDHAGTYSLMKKLEGDKESEGPDPLHELEEFATKILADIKTIREA